MSHYFDGSWGLIRVRARVAGAQGDVEQLFLLDTGSDTSSISHETAVLIGCETAEAEIEMVTAGGTVTVPIVRVASLTALGLTRSNHPVTVHTLPESIGVDGILGLDFFRRQRLCLDFDHNTITLG